MAIRSWFGGKKHSPEDEPAEPQIQPPAQAAPSQPPPPAKAQIDFVAVLTAAGLSPEAHGRVVKAKQLQRSMPAGTPDAAKRQIVEAAFQAFEIPTQKIVESASAEIVALRSYIRAGEEEKATKVAEGQRRIAELEDQIREARAAMDRASAAQAQRLRLTTEEIATVEPIVQFFAQGKASAKDDVAIDVNEDADADGIDVETTNA
jgi:hypothetical protein